MRNEVAMSTERSMYGVGGHLSVFIAAVRIVPREYKRSCGVVRSAQLQCNDTKLHKLRTLSCVKTICLKAHIGETGLPSVFDKHRKG